MRPQHAYLLAAVAASLIQPGARADDPEGREHRITVIASPAALPMGAQCVVEMAPETNDRHETVELSHEGKIAEAKDDGIALIISSTRQVITKEGPASRLPIANRFFRNVGIGRPKPGAEQKVWIPAEKIRSVKLAANAELSRRDREQ